jgi:NAD(P)-dependent dehydrogenase (short-subunit alcohol dehydrogenase family)
MTKPLQNKLALVTGASKGLGKAIALRLARDGAAVIVNYASDKAGADGVVQTITKDGGKAYALQGDVSKVANIRKMFTELDGILKTHGVKSLDILVNNAGVFPMGGLEDATEETFDKIFDVNVKGLFFTTQEAAKRLAKGGRIVNISTGLTRFTAPMMSLYSASKGAVDILTRDFAATLGSRGITVNAVHPGLTATEGTSNLTSNKDMIGEVVKGTALGRLGQPDDIADVVAFFCSNDARWVTAGHIEASGGVRL